MDLLTQPKQIPVKVPAKEGPQFRGEITYSPEHPISETIIASLIKHSDNQNQRLAEDVVRLRRHINKLVGCVPEKKDEGECKATAEAQLDQLAQSSHIRTVCLDALTEEISRLEKI